MFEIIKNTRKQILAYVVTVSQLLVLKFIVALTNGSTRTIFSMRKNTRIEKITC